MNRMNLAMTVVMTAPNTLFQFPSFGICNKPHPQCDKQWRLYRVARYGDTFPATIVASVDRALSDLVVFSAVRWLKYGNLQ